MMTKIMMIAVLFSLAAAAQNINYTYDASGRLALADYGNGTQIQYTYDDSGNLLSRMVVTPSASSAAKPRSSSDADRAAKKNPPQGKPSAPPANTARPPKS